jgi:hypothetical protein
MITSMDEFQEILLKAVMAVIENSNRFVPYTEIESKCLVLFYLINIDIDFRETFDKVPQSEINALIKRVSKMAAFKLKSKQLVKVPADILAYVNTLYEFGIIKDVDKVMKMLIEDVEICDTLEFLSDMQEDKIKYLPVDKQRVVQKCRDNAYKIINPISKTPEIV